MPGLTVTEKEHWKDRISRRLDKRIEAIAAEEPNLLDRVHREARQRALRSLGLAEMQTELDAIDEQEKALEKREHQLSKAMLAHVRGVSPDDIRDSYYGGHAHEEVVRAVTRRQVVHEDELLAASERGQRIRQLRQERDNLLDIVWLASSSRQIKQLWGKVATLLGDEPTPLERDALAIDSIGDE